MAVLQRLSAFLALLLIAGVVHGYPATPGGYNAGGYTGATAQAACQAYGLAQAAAQPKVGGQSATLSSYGPYSPTCFVYCQYPGYGGNLCGQTANTSYAATCPGGGTLSGGTCTCPVGHTDTGTSCVDPQAELCTALSGTETYASATGSISPGASSCNATGCMTTFAGTLIRITDRQGVTVTEGAATFTGATCSYSSETGSAEDTCPGGYQGEVNGVQTCVKYDPKLNTIETEGSKESEVSEDGNTTQQSSSTTTTCSNGSCNSTTTTTTTVNGGTPTTKTETSSEPQTEYCTKNPRAPQCQEATSFGGSCASSFTCTGDPVQCAAARAANEHLCRFDDLFDMDGTTRALAEAVINGTHVVNPKDTPHVVDVGMFDQSSPISTACPADVPFTLSGMALSIPLSQYCSQLQLMGNILVLFTLLGATVFVFRGST